MDEQKREYRTYTEEFKLEALELLRSSGKSGGQIERELGITPPLLLSTPTPRSADIPFTLPPSETFGGYCAGTSRGRIPKQLGSSNRVHCENIPKIVIPVG